ncbi:hypothetical protein IFM89_030080 [Coptis chinensis]|uniref:Uncharacterized protein n=1 Tax=Coptis chinensis TaxID=261450 RepID=A0A835MAA2_9MAGN|nr:hypothetical protein IFM89_030080 [Coptis chinensis]
MPRFVSELLPTSGKDTRSRQEMTERDLREERFIISSGKEASSSQAWIRKLALCGFKFVLTHLDNRQLLIKSNPGEVVKPNQFKAINDKGMPMYQRPFMRGKLYIHFTVEFPDSLTTDQPKVLETVLPLRASTQLTDMEVDECEETTLHNINIEEQMRRKQAHSQEANDNDEESHGGAQRVQCAQQ